MLDLRQWNFNNLYSGMWQSGQSIINARFSEAVIVYLKYLNQQILFEKILHCGIVILRYPYDDYPIWKK